MTELPNKYDHKFIEQKWSKNWDVSGVYRWSSEFGREGSFVVDTPPPTVSGSLHMGHVFSYTHTDVIVRYQRMLGKNIMYPMGWDDNGLPTERRVQNVFNISCSPELPYDPSWKPVATVSKDSKITPKEISRKNFIEACSILTSEDEAAFENLWRHLGLSVDWSMQYATIDNSCRRVSQFSFLDLVEKGFIYNSDSPTIWDYGYQTALAQADLEDRICAGAYYDLRFKADGEGEFVISTTRPELLVSCIAVVAHPKDERYLRFFGKSAMTPLFRARVPILPSEHADPEKGTGIMMVCTFGDIADVEWWKSSSLPIKQVIGTDGRFKNVDFTKDPFLSAKPGLAQEAYAHLCGKTPEAARKTIVQLLSAPASAPDEITSALVGEPKPIEHPVKFYEKGEKPVEYIVTRQWFVRLLNYKEDLLAQGEKISWHPQHMKHRYLHWVEGINHDWCISRQRYFGVPFPVWYPIDLEGNVDYNRPIFATSDQLPVDPFVDVPKGYTEKQRNQAGGFLGDRDVMDTWATSALTPQIISHWDTDGVRHSKIFPMDIRPQSHEIIRTWAFYTIAKAWMHSKEVPWRNIVISGWILDPDRKKMSKSKGNVITPQHLIEQYSADGVRYWAARARLGVDTAYDEKVFVAGQKLATKIFNASRFVLAQVIEFESLGRSSELSFVKEELDLAQIDELRGVINQAAEAFQRFEYAAALQSAEASFWLFCDNYVEIVKGRVYADNDLSAKSSAVATLKWSLSVYLRLFAPFVPYVTEEVWSWYWGKQGLENSIHRSKWPSCSEVSEVRNPSETELLDSIALVVSAIRFKKSLAQKTLKWPVKKIKIRAVKADINRLNLVTADLIRVGRIMPDGISVVEGNNSEQQRFDVELELADQLD